MTVNSSGSIGKAARSSQVFSSHRIEIDADLEPPGLLLLARIHKAAEATLRPIAHRPQRGLRSRTAARREEIGNLADPALETSDCRYRSHDRAGLFPGCD